MMSPHEQQLMASYAESFRRMASESEGEAAERRLLTAKAFERQLSNDLVNEYRRGTHRASEDRPLEITREQKQTIWDLATEYESVSPARFLPDGSVLAECFQYRESDGAPELVAVHEVKPSGVVF